MSFVTMKIARILVLAAVAGGVIVWIVWVNLDRLARWSPQAVRAKVIGNNIESVSGQLKRGDEG